MKDCDALLTVPYFSGLKDEIVCSILEHSFDKKLKIGEHLFMADEICVKKNGVRSQHLTYDQSYNILPRWQDH